MLFYSKKEQKAVGLLVRDRLQATAKLQKSFNAGNYFLEKKTTKLPPPILQQAMKQNDIGCLMKQVFYVNELKPYEVSLQWPYNITNIGESLI